jgi:hypothetical protein
VGWVKLTEPGAGHRAWTGPADTAPLWKARYSLVSSVPDRRCGRRGLRHAACPSFGCRPASSAAARDGTDDAQPRALVERIGKCRLSHYWSRHSSSCRRSLWSWYRTRGPRNSKAATSGSRKGHRVSMPFSIIKRSREPATQCVRATPHDPASRQTRQFAKEQTAHGVRTG